MGTLKSKRAKACDIPKRVKERVWERDGGCCIFCGNGVNVMPNAHVIPRSKGGLGVEENIVTACTMLTKNKCHYYLDNGDEWQRKTMLESAERYLRQHYPGWDKDKYTYRKGV